MPSSTTEARDIYDLLGISPEASPKMAQAMYWARIRELREAERAGDPNARDEIEQLNDALQIISDDSRRAAYNRGEELPEPSVTGTSGAATPIPARRGKRSPRAVAVGAGIFAGSVIALFATNAAGIDLLARPVPPLIFILVIGTLGSGLVGAGLQRRVIRTPFDVLELAPDATPEDIDFAYRTLASSWLAQLRNAPDLALESLEQLDRAYTVAMAPHVDSLAHGSANPVEALQNLAAWLRGRDWQQVAGGAVAFTGRVIAGTARVVTWGVTSIIAVYRGEEVARFNQEELETPEIQLDLQRRLSASVEVLAQEGFEQPRETGEVTKGGGLYEIVLETPVGARRIPLGERPLRIGSAADADIAVELVAADGNEQVLLWVNGEDLVLHATAGATCAVNGTPSTWARLEVGDTITIGATVLKVDHAQRVEAA